MTHRQDPSSQHGENWPPSRASLNAVLAYAVISGVAVAINMVWLTLIGLVPVVWVLARGIRRSGRRRVAAFAELKGRASDLSADQREREIRRIIERFGGGMLPSTRKAISDIRAKSKITEGT
jgi:type VI protein secretion system component VasK